MDLYSCTDYRQYLKDYFARQKEAVSHFSFRFFARIAGFSSPGFLKMVMEGERNLSSSSINKLTKGLKLNQKESAFFEALVLFNQAESRRDKDLYFERLASLKPHIKFHGLEKDQYEYFTQKHYVILREMVALPDFREDPAWIAQRLGNSLKTRDVEYSLALLIRLGLLKRDENGKLIQTDATLSTPPEVDSMEVASFHRAMLDTAKESLLDVPAEKRHFSSLTIPIPKNSIPEIKSRIENFREEIMSLINEGSADYFEVYQMNVQLFPVTRAKNSAPHSTRK